MQFTQALHRAVQQHPDRVVSIFGDRQRTCAEQYDRVSRLATGLCKLGVRPLNRVAILAHNSDRYLEYYLAVPWTGAQVVPVNFRWSIEEIGYSLNDCEAIALFIDDAFVDQVDALLDACTFVRMLIYCGDGECPEGMVSMETLIAENEPMEDVTLKESPLGKQILGIFYTGGTTGRSKGVMLSHRAVTNSGMAILAECDGALSGDSVGIHIAPMFHLADMMQTTALILSGGTHVILPAFKPDTVLQTVAQHGVTDILLVPAMLQALVHSPDIDKHDLTSVRTLLYGGSPASETLIERAMECFPNASFYQDYGMTEIAAAGTILPPEQHLAAAREKGRLRSAGHAAHQMMMRIVAEDGSLCGPGTIGEITFRGPSLMDRYLNKPKATKAVMKKGWYYTGDLGYMDEEGYLYIVDRAKDMIVSGGENVYCAEVENAISKHPAIAACAVIGIPDEALGEKVHAVVVLKPDTKLSQDELYAHCKSLIGGYKCPRSMETRDNLPISGAGKVLKTELRKPWWGENARQVN